MSAAFDTLLRNLDEHEIRYDIDTEGSEVRFFVNGKASDYQVFAEIDDVLLKVFAYPGIHVPAGARPQVAELFCRINWCIKAGDFEMDMDDGQVRHYSYLAITNDDLAGDAIEYVLGVAFGVLGDFVPAILSCIYGNIEPVEAVRHILPSKGGGERE